MTSEVEIQPWSANEYANLALVQEVKKHPCLYNNTIPEYSQKNVTGPVWQEIADKFGCSVTKIRKRWKSIRAVYFRHKVLWCEGKKKQKHYLDKHLTFLLPFTHSRKLMKEFANLSKGNSVIDYSNEQTTSSEAKSTPTEKPKPIAKLHFRKKREKIKHEVKLRRIMPKPTIVNAGDNLQNNPIQTILIAPAPQPPVVQKDSAADCEDFRKQFMMSLLPEVEEMSEPKFRTFKRKILFLIDDVKADD